ncbi:MAG: gliding motility-associated C-terminal domain-containing protein, partial [Bacteroidales bacterium]|nr:gliding motility-associated C-terminal domain-containing protein [Bacteroidales bacterium]
GRNDRFLPVYENIIQYKIYVFNRWGQQIYESNIIDEGWDGKFKGKDCPDGVYFFLAIFTDDYHNIAKEITGSITLLR